MFGTTGFWAFTRYTGNCLELLYRLTTGKGGYTILLTWCSLQFLVRLIGMSLVKTEINIRLSDGNPPYFLSSWTSKEHVPKYQIVDEGGRRRLRGPSLQAPVV